MTDITAVPETEDLPSVESEINDHKKEISAWINLVSTLAVSDSRKDVTKRFLRDCNTCIEDLNASETPSSADLDDFVNRKNSLEIQYNDLTENVG